MYSKPPTIHSSEIYSHSKINKLKTNNVNSIFGNISEWKLAVRLATTANITLSGLQIIDVIQTVDQDRILVKDQTNKIENGIYLCNNNNWTRAIDTKEGTPSLMFVYVKEGTVGKEFIYHSLESGTIGINEINYNILNNSAVSVPAIADNFILIQGTDSFIGKNITYSETASTSTFGFVLDSPHPYISGFNISQITTPLIKDSKPLGLLILLDSDTTDVGTTKQTLRFETQIMDSLVSGYSSGITLSTGNYSVASKDILTIGADITFATSDLYTTGLTQSGSRAGNIYIRSGDSTGNPRKDIDILFIDTSETTGKNIYFNNRVSTTEDLTYANTTFTTNSKDAIFKSNHLYLEITTFATEALFATVVDITNNMQGYLKYSQVLALDSYIDVTITRSIDTDNVISRIINSTGTGILSISTITIAPTSVVFRISNLSTANQMSDIQFYYMMF